MGSEMLLLGQQVSSSSGMRSGGGVGAQRSIPHWLCKATECRDGQDSRMDRIPGWTGHRKDRTPGQTHPECGGGSFWSWFVPDSQFSSLDVSHSPLPVCLCLLNS